MTDKITTIRKKNLGACLGHLDTETVERLKIVVNKFLGLTS
jgi:mRNA-degrading endonuclease toxin of MazEF toxin-antitoxin module